MLTSKSVDLQHFLKKNLCVTADAYGNASTVDFRLGPS